MGGMQVLEWGVMFPERVALARRHRHRAAATAQQIALELGRAQRHRPRPAAGAAATTTTPRPATGPHQGLALARELAQITYRTDEVFTDRFGGRVVDPLDDRFTLWQRFEVERYLDYHGAKLVRRFDANSYLVLTKAMDLHDLGRGRGGIDGPLRPHRRCPCSSIGIAPTSCTRLPAAGSSRDGLARARARRASTSRSTAPHGHDALPARATTRWATPSPPSSPMWRNDA